VGSEQFSEPGDWIRPRGGPLITVAICTHNRAAYLDEAIRSVLAQIHDDTELLVVDNASTDNTAQVVRQFASHQPPVVGIYEARPGISFARNTAFLKARGRYVLFLDDDATAEPGLACRVSTVSQSSPFDKDCRARWRGASPLRSAAAPLDQCH